MANGYLTDEQRQQAQQAAQERAQAFKETQQRKQEQVDEDTARTEERTREQLKRAERQRPTPTQRENDLAKVGALDLDAPKENDQYGDDEREAIAKTMGARLPEGYETRQVDPGTRSRRSSGSSGSAQGSAA